MARPVPPERFDAILRAATAVFLRSGYRRTQMADVAAELGVAKGTLYLYVESKEALLEQVLLHADRTEPVALPRALPVPTPRPGAILRKVRARIRKEASLPLLAAASRRRRAADAPAELRGIVAELLRLLASHRDAIKLLDRCAPDYPELAAVWLDEGRTGVLALLEAWLRKRIAAGQLAPVADVRATARIVVELAAFWAVHRHWDPTPQTPGWSDAAVEAALVEFVERALRGDLP